MQREAVCALADWLSGATAPAWGVNALLPNVPRDPLDAAAPAPIALVADPYRNDNANDFTARPSKLPALYVLPDGPVAMEGAVNVVDRKARSVSVGVRVIVENPNAAKSERYADYVTRAVCRSIAAFLAEDATADAARTRESVRIVAANTIVAGPWRESVGEAMAVAVIAVDFQCRDRAPTG